MHTQEIYLTRFLDAKSDLQKNRTEPAGFLKTEPKPNRT